MPFATGARLTMTNEGSQRVDSCYFNIDYRLENAPVMPVRPRLRGPMVDDRIRYFHTQYRQAFPVPKGEDYLILQAEGHGHHVGTFLSVMANSDGWWGEGNDKWTGPTSPPSRGRAARTIFAAPG